jgi:spore coat protein U-like protein
MLYTYSFLDSVATISGPGGTFNLSGETQGNADEGVTFEYEEDKGSITMSAGGGGMHNLHASNAGSATVRLLKNSHVNQLLSNLYNSQSTRGTLWGQNVIRCSNRTSGDVLVLSLAAFKRHSPITYAKDGGTNEWQFRGIKLSIKLGQGG